jgi:hypothetical protein
MSISIYDASSPVLIRGLNNLSGILKKAEAFAETRKIDPSVLINARLAPDMFAFARQVQIVSDTAKGCAARLSESEAPSYPDEETTFDQLQERIRKTVAYIESVDRSKIEGAEDRTITMKFPGRELNFSGRDYLLNFVLPNFYFHMSAAYMILRHNGVDVGKMDFLGGV